jgi:hypothetical protein
VTSPTAPQQQPQQTPSQRDRQIIAGIAAILAAGVATSAAMSTLTALLAPLRINPAAARGAYQVAIRVTGKGSRSTTAGPAEKATRQAADTYRAAYILAAARRINDAVSAAGGPAAQRAALTAAIQRETRYAGQHVHAQANREASARAVDVASARVGKAQPDGTRLLGWKAVMDDRTSAECRAANGRNFSATRPPAIGLPGAVHPHCRCKPVKAYAGAGLVDDIPASATTEAA